MKRQTLPPSGVDAASPLERESRALFPSEEKGLRHREETDEQDTTT